MLFFLVGAIDRVGIQLPSLVTGELDLRASYVAMLPIRLALLKSTAFALGVFAWRTTRTDWGGGALDKAWRGLGYVMLLVGAGFVFAFIPAPLAILVWATALAVREVRRPTGVS